MKIALTKSEGTDVSNYISWLKAVRKDIECIELAGLTAEEARQALHRADGLLLTGGADVDPVRYEHEDYRELCKIDAVRDEMEFALIHHSRELRMPVLGICRGMQILNVAYGGTLVADIPTQQSTTTEHRRNSETNEDSMHGVEMQPGTILRHYVGVFEGTVNSAHHQCVDQLADVFTPSAYSIDGIIEALEWGDASLGGKPFLFAVQWHPERLAYDNPMSLPIATHFLLEVDAYRVLVKPGL
ncbi:MAG: gamma-glutamyl-gamma-aminobutyrate hydrolase family protein [Ignavibacteria bacterium]|nr:gamma-glutamyl-gamma-aminobutyrate hydrolase family protein [Ignavibacteria bacterium]